MTVMTHSETHIEWTSPAALWDGFHTSANDAQRRIFRTPAILRFDSDTFMNDFMNVMQLDPHRMTDFLAVPEQWHTPAAPPSTVVLSKKGLPGQLERARNAALRRLAAREAVIRQTQWNLPAVQPEKPESPLKLYQPAHQRYDLVTAGLVCRTLGLPDRPLDTAAQERVTFVIRRVVPKVATTRPNLDDSAELALVDGRWQAVANGAQLVPGEEQHPLSPLTYVEIDGRRRRLLNGLIPVAKREALFAAPMPTTPDGAAAPKAIDPRQMLLKQQVLGPWAELEKVAARAIEGMRVEKDGPAGTVLEDTRTRANDQIQVVSWYVLLDLRKWLQTNLPAVLTAIDSGNTTPLSTPEMAKQKAAYDELGKYPATGTTLRTAVAQIAAHETKLESVKVRYQASTASQWPSMKYQLLTVSSTSTVDNVLDFSVREAIEKALSNALPTMTVALPPRAIAQAAASEHTSTAWFAIRCVFERPRCATLSPPVVSEPTAAFQVAGFFDSDAPARAIRITMPADTTPAGLRKHDKNAAFVISDVLCGQLSGMSGLSLGDLVRSVLPWPFHKDLDVNAGNSGPCPSGAGGAGMVCSFSIPIITICALILLLIIVKLLDFAFFWMPFFQICLPLPKFDAKKES